MTWTGQSFSVGQVLTAAQMTNLQADITAMANGDSGAPGVTQAALDSNVVSQAKMLDDSVGQGEVKTASQQENGTGYFTAAGGVYVIGHTLAKRSGFARLATRESDDDSDSGSYLARWLLTAPNSTNDAVFLYYINASPPYDLGDGDIPLFMYLGVNTSSKHIDRINLAPDPVWAYNGPTNITPSRYGKDGKTYRQRKDMSGHPNTLEQAKAKGAKEYFDYIDAFNKANQYEEEITQEIKNADMPLIPAPWNPDGSDMQGKTMVMIDPMSSVLRDIQEFREKYDEFDSTDIIRNYIKIGNTSLNRKGPPGIQIVSAKWRHTP